MSDKKTLSTRLDDLADRFEGLENRIDALSHGMEGDFESQDGPAQVCAVPVVPRPDYGPDVSGPRAEAIWAIGRTWVNHTNLHYYMFDSGRFGGAADQRAVVREAFDVWKDVGIGLGFTEVSDISESEIRIGFLRNNGSWSAVGTDALRWRQHERTMNFGWDITQPGRNGLDTAIHEIGHALGFYHEHQNPNAGIVWNREAVYDYYARTQSPPWDRAKTDFNILDKVDPTTVEGSDWDPNSIMHYPIARGLIRQPARYRNGLSPALGLSDKDKAVVRRLYPAAGPGVIFPELRRWEAQTLSLGPGEQRDFNVLPDATGTYRFQTFGEADTVVVLFEEDETGYRYLDGDDDSGTDRNARLEVRLVKGRRYQLRVRLYYSAESGDTAVMMW